MEHQYQVSSYPGFNNQGPYFDDFNPGTLPGHNEEDSHARMAADFRDFHLEDRLASREAGRQIKPYDDYIRGN